MRLELRSLGFDRGFLVELLRSVPRQPLLWFLLAVDAVVILLHIWIIGLVPNEQLPRWTDWFRLSLDGSLAEGFEYAKGAVAGLLLLSVARTRVPAITPVALLPLYLVADNAFQIHERFAHWLLPEHQNRGELAVSVVIALIMVAVAALAYRMANPRGRSAILAVLIGIFLIGFMAAGVDALHAIVKQFSFHLGRVFLILEDGGELVAQSVLLVICTVVWRRLGDEGGAGQLIDFGVKT